MFQCVNANGYLVHLYYGSMKCWTGMHILHACAGLLFAIIYATICIIISMTFFETKTTSNSADARINARNDLILLGFKLIMILLMTYFINPAFNWFIAIILFLGGAFIYLRVRSERSYYNETVNNFVDILNGIYFSGSVVLLIAMITQFTSFNSSIVLMLIGVPLIALLIGLLPDNRRSLLMKTIDQVETGEKWQLKIKYYFLLVKERDTNRNSSIILNGFINEHESTCENPDCPLKAYLITSQNKEKEKNKNKIISNDANQLLISFAGKMYVEGLSKFQKSTSLRIAYAFFLLEKMSNKNMAIAEFVIAEKHSPPVDEQFIIYRYKKMIEDEYSDLQGDSGQDAGGNLDVVSLLAFDNHYRQCRLQIEKAASLHMEFWTTLTEDHPDLAKLSKSGSRINTTIMAVEEHWSKMQKLNPNTTKGIKLYSDFLINVLNDDEGGRELMSRARDTSYVKATITDTNNLSNPMTFAPDGTACVIAGSEKGKVGEILNINMGVCRIFGYSKAEIVGKNVEILMPQMYAKEHSKILMNCVNSSNDEATKGNERFVIGSHKSQYILPLILTTKLHLSVNQGIQFIGLFKTEKKSINVCYLLLDKTKNILGVSSRTLSYLKINNKMARLGKINVEMLSEQFTLESNSQAFISKGGLQVEVFQLEQINDAERRQGPHKDLAMNSYITDIVINGHGSSHNLKEKVDGLDGEPIMKVKASKNTLKCICNMSEIHILDSEIVGYIVRIEPIFENKLGISSQDVDRQPKPTNFQFLFDPFEGRYIREVNDMEKEKKLQESFHQARNQNSLSALTNSQISASKVPNTEENKEELVQAQKGEGDDEKSVKSSHRNKEKNDSSLYRINYAEGIETFRWTISGEFEPVNVETNMLEVRKKEETQLVNIEDVKKKSEDSKSMVSQKNSLKLKKKALNNAITEKTVPSSILQLKRAGYAIILALICLIAIEFGLIQSKFSEIIQNYNMINFSYRQIIIQMRISYEIYKYCIFKKSGDPKFTSSLSDAEYLTQRKQYINNFLTEFYGVQSNLSLNQLSMSDTNSELYNKQVVSLLFLGNNIGNSNIMTYTLTEALLLMASSVFTVTNNLNTTADINDQNIYFVLYNSFWKLTESMFLTADHFVKDLYDRTDSKYIMVLIMYIISLVILVGSILILFPVVASVSRSKIKVLKLFLDIPLGNVRQLQKKCESFIISYQEEGKDDNNSNLEGLSEDKSNTADDLMIAEKGLIGRSRYFKNQKSTNLPFFIKYIIGIIVVESYFAVNFALNKVYLNDVNNYNKELNVTALFHTQQSYTLTVFEALLAYDKILPLNQSSTFNLIALNKIQALYSIATDIQNIHNSNEQSTLGSEYVSQFNEIMRRDLCYYSSDFKFLFKCSSFIDGIVTEGLHPVIIYFIESVRDMLRDYNQIKAEASTTMNQDLTKLLNNDLYTNIETINNEISESSFTYLRNGLVNALTGRDSVESTRRVIMFVIVLLLLCVIFIALWNPFVNNLNKEVN